jgi:hypothetical protein
MIDGVSFTFNNITTGEAAANEQLEMDIRACLATWIATRRALLEQTPTLEWYTIVSAPDDKEEYLEDESIVDYMIKNPDYLLGATMYFIHTLAQNQNNLDK